MSRSKAKGGDDMIAEMQTAKVKDDYESKLALISRAFNEISRLCFEHDYHLTPEDWATLDAARLDDESLSYDELRSRLAQLYLRIKRAATSQAGKGVITCPSRS
jgi:hypothetical protein